MAFCHFYFDLLSAYDFKWNIIVSMTEIFHVNGVPICWWNICRIVVSFLSCLYFWRWRWCASLMKLYFTINEGSAMKTCFIRSLKTYASPILWYRDCQPSFWMRHAISSGLLKLVNILVGDDEIHGMNDASQSIILKIFILIDDWFYIDICRTLVIEARL